MSVDQANIRMLRALSTSTEMMADIRRSQEQGHDGARTSRLVLESLSAAFSDAADALEEAQRAALDHGAS